MIHHYVNLTCWKDVYELYDPIRDIVWVDSISLQIIAWCSSKCTVFHPGVMMLERIKLDFAKMENVEWFFLTPELNINIPAEKQYVLPFFEDSDINFPDSLVSILNSLPSKTYVALGISSPKQNYLATILYNHRSDLEYHCLGAALELLGSSIKYTRYLYYMSWLRLLLLSPRRTIKKLKTTFQQILVLCTKNDSRKYFAKFMDICQK